MKAWVFILQLKGSGGQHKQDYPAFGNSVSFYIIAGGKMKQSTLCLHYRSFERTRIINKGPCRDKSLSLLSVFGENP